jgi:hypothetical protein
MSDDERRSLGVDVLVGNRMKHMIPEMASDWFGKKEAGTALSLFRDDIMTGGSWTDCFLTGPDSTRERSLRSRTDAAISAAIASYPM